VRYKGVDIPLQIKSSYRGAEEHQKDFPDIPVVIINRKKFVSFPNDIENDFKNKIKDAYNVRLWEKE
jgi:hypothetical protein